MSLPSDPGFNLTGDLATLLSDGMFHDVTICCADGVEVGASRNVLAARSAVFKAMLYSGQMRESISGHVALPQIGSAALRIVLLFIYTGDVDGAAPLDLRLSIETYRAAAFFILPELMRLVIAQNANARTAEHASALLNETVTALPPAKDNLKLYEELLRPFCARRLLPGDLDTLSVDALELLLTRTAAASHFYTNESDLLVHVIDWAWAMGDDTPPAEHRRRTLAALDNMDDWSATVPNMLVELDDRSNDLLAKMTRYINLRLICPHRLIRFMDSVPALAGETTPQHLAFFHHTCGIARCPPGHPSEYRGLPHSTWNEQAGLVVSNRGTVVAYPEASGSAFHRMPRTARFKEPVAMESGGRCEWDVVIESSGVWNQKGEDAVGFFDGESNRDTHLWNSRSKSYYLRSVGFKTYRNNGGGGAPQEVDYGRPFGSGDVITFHLDRGSRTCSVSINGTNYGTAFDGFGGHVYPAVTLLPQARYQLRTRLQ